jgi:hypothetical protein
MPTDVLFLHLGHVTQVLRTPTAGKASELPKAALVLPGPIQFGVPPYPGPRTA